MSDVMMKALQIQNQSLLRQVEKLGPENERVRRLLTEFDARYDRDQREILHLRSKLEDQGICADCMGSGESGPDQTCCTCGGSGAEFYKKEAVEAAVAAEREACAEIADGEAYAAALFGEEQWVRASSLICSTIRARATTQKGD